MGIYGDRVFWFFLSRQSYQHDAGDKHDFYVVAVPAATRGRYGLSLDGMLCICICSQEDLEEAGFYWVNLNAIHFIPF